MPAKPIIVKHVEEDSHWLNLHRVVADRLAQKGIEGVDPHAGKVGEG